MAQTDLLTELRYMFPWFDDLGLSGRWFQDLVATSASTEEIISKLRQEPAYRKRFPGLWRQDGSMRMSEAEYVQTETAYRNLLRQYGFPESAYSTPDALAGVFESEQDPNEFAERLDVYDKVKNGSQAVRDAFYVYAGMDLSVDDLFEAVVDKDLAANLVGTYRERVAQGFDYQTFIDRTTTLAGKRAAELIKMADNTVTIQNVPKDPTLTRQLLDVLYTAGGGTGEQPLGLQELLAAYEEAVIGAAASGAGLGLPTKERIAEIRAAGIERARAQQAYLEFGRQAGTLSGANQRQGGAGIGRTEFENAAFFGQMDSVRALEMAAAAEKAAGQSQGVFRFDQNETGDLFQRGLS